jgi:hypothetical protein
MRTTRSLLCAGGQGQTSYLSFNEGGIRKGAIFLVKSLRPFLIRPLSRLRFGAVIDENYFESLLGQALGTVPISA